MNLNVEKFKQDTHNTHALASQLSPDRRELLLEKRSWNLEIQFYLPVTVLVKHFEHLLDLSRGLDTQSHHREEFVQLYCSILILDTK